MTSMFHSHSYFVRIAQMNKFSSVVFEDVLCEVASCIDKFYSMNMLVLLRTLPEPQLFGKLLSSGVPGKGGSVSSKLTLCCIMVLE